MIWVVFRPLTRPLTVLGLLVAALLTLNEPSGLVTLCLLVPRGQLQAPSRPVPVGPAGSAAGYCMSFRTPCGAWLAWASIEVPACCRTWDLVKLDISWAMSVSVMDDFDALRFSTATFRLLIVSSNRFW